MSLLKVIGDHRCVQMRPDAALRKVLPPMLISCLRSYYEYVDAKGDLHSKILAAGTAQRSYDI